MKSFTQKNTIGQAIIIIGGLGVGWLGKYNQQLNRQEGSLKKTDNLKSKDKISR